MALQMDANPMVLTGHNFHIPTVTDTAKSDHWRYISLYDKCVSWLSVYSKLQKKNGCIDTPRWRNHLPMKPPSLPRGPHTETRSKASTAAQCLISLPMRGFRQPEMAAAEKKGDVAAQFIATYGDLRRGFTPLKLMGSYGNMAKLNCGHFCCFFFFFFFFFCHNLQLVRCHRS